MQHKLVRLSSAHQAAEQVIPSNEGITTWHVQLIETERLMQNNARRTDPDEISVLGGSGSLLRFTQPRRAVSTAHTSGADGG